jgi:hypothetical protein
MKRIFTENVKYKELERMNVGIDFCRWILGQKEEEGYIYFEEDTQGNRAETFYKTLGEALVEYDDAPLFHGEEIDREW